MEVSAVALGSDLRSAALGEVHKPKPEPEEGQFACLGNLEGWGTGIDFSLLTHSSTESSKQVLNS